MKTAYATIKGIEVMRALRKGQASSFYYGQPQGEVCLSTGFSVSKHFLKGTSSTQISICNSADFIYFLFLYRFQKLNKRFHDGRLITV